MIIQRDSESYDVPDRLPVVPLRDVVIFPYAVMPLLIGRASSLAAVEAALATLAAKVYFDFDRSDLRPDARSVLDAKLPILRANPGLRLRISGHADERGSDEYNLALGQARAAAVRRYLMDNGIDGGRLEIVSFGEARPAVDGHDESAWSQNRRCEFEIVAGRENIVVPSAGGS